jgi:flagellar biogenesis protein FliO
MIELEAFVLTIIFVALVLLLAVIGIAVWLVRTIKECIGKSTDCGKLKEKQT